jgi:hypothetical protein
MRWRCSSSAAERMPPGRDHLETFADFRDWKASHPDEAENYQRQIRRSRHAEVSQRTQDQQGSPQSRFRHFTPDEFPTHRMLQELMMLDPMGAERDQIMEIATLILPWCRDGNYGCLFDGTSNLSLTGKIAHFELGYIPESAKELKAAAGFLITNHARKHIMTLPRAIRKRNVYEEVARFLDIPGGQEIVQESYAQLRKFNCWNISIVQQYARFKQSPHPLRRVRQFSRQFFIMRQNDRADLDDMGKDIALPEVTQHAIMNYPLPDHQPGRSIRRSPICTPTRRATSAARSTTSPRRRCSIAPVRAVNTSTVAPASYAKAPASSKESSITPIAVRRKQNPKLINAL